MTQPKRSIIILGLLTGLLACTPTADRETVGPVTEAQTEPVTEAQTEATQEQPKSTAPSETAQTRTETPSEPKIQAASGAAASGAADSGAALIPDNPDAEAPVKDAELSTNQAGELCGDQSTQREMNLCAQESYKQADVQLNRVYQDVIGDLPPSGQQALSAAELAWIEFRDRNCTFAKNQFVGGSIAPLIYNSCLETHTNARIAELKQPQLPQSNYQAADAQLNETYQALLAVLSGPETEDITDIQLAWIEYRDLNCDFETSYGTAVIEESQCLARMSETRTTQLKQDIDQRSL